MGLANCPRCNNLFNKMSAIAVCPNCIVEEQVREDKIKNYLKRKNTLVKGESNIPGCENFLKFSLGPVKYMKLIINTLVKFK